MRQTQKIIGIKQEDFAQLNIYIQLVTEAINLVETRHKRKIELNDFVSNLCIHGSVLDDYFKKLIKTYNIKDLPNLGD